MRSSHARILKEGTLPAIRRDPEVLIRELRCNPSSRSPIQKSDLDEKRFINFLDRVRLFGEHGRQRPYTHRTTLILLDDGQ